MAIKRIEKTRNEEIGARGGVVNICEKIREARLRWLGHVKRKTEEDVVMRRWKMEVRGHRRVRRPKLRWLGHVERKTEDHVAMRTWKMAVRGHRRVRRPKLRWSDVNRKRHKEK